MRLSEEDQLKQKVPVFKTETKKRTLNPTWDPTELSVQQLCRGDEFRSIVAEVYDWNRTQADKLIGSATTCLADLKRASEDGKPVILALYEQVVNDPKSTKKKKPRCMGQLVVL